MALPALASAAPVALPLERPATVLRKPLTMPYTALAQAGSRVVALGERGAVLWSDNSGAAWHQARVPVSVTLTAAQFVSPREGWAVGHGGVVLHTQDGGESWTLQLDGQRLAALALAQAEALPPAGDGVPSPLLERARQLKEDGADKPLLDLCFDASGHGVVVGAYGIVLGTQDGGRQWQPWLERVPNPKGLHFNAVRCLGQDIVIAGEQGLILRSGDGGQSFQALTSPYRGSFFAASLGQGGQLTLAGLRGHVFHSDDLGANWQPVALNHPASVTSLVTWTDGSLVATNQAGHVYVSRDQGHSFVRWAAVPAAPRLSMALRVPDGSLLLAGLGGLSRWAKPLDFPAAPPAASTRLQQGSR